MNEGPRLEGAAKRVLLGDESREAASALEGAIVDDFPGDERLDELLYALCMYSPGAGAPYLDARELREVLKRALVSVGEPRERR